MDKFLFAKQEIPRLIERRLRELRKNDPSTSYEVALKQIGREYPDIWTDYARSIASDGGL